MTSETHLPAVRPAAFPVLVTQVGPVAAKVDQPSLSDMRIYDPTHGVVSPAAITETYNPVFGRVMEHILTEEFCTTEDGFRPRHPQG